MNGNAKIILFELVSHFSKCLQSIFSIALFESIHHTRMLLANLKTEQTIIERTNTFNSEYYLI